MGAQVLFIAVEAGAAGFLEPIWRGLGGTSRTVLAGPGACRYLAQRRRMDGVVALAPQNGLPVADAGRPALIVASASAAPVELAAVRAARRWGIPCLQVVDSWYNFAGRFRVDDPADWPDRVVVIDDFAVAAAIAEGIPSALPAAVGHPGWEEVGPLPPADPTVVAFVDQPVARLYGNSLGYTEETAWEVVAEAARRRPGLISEVIYCPHPSRDGLPSPAQCAGIPVTVATGEAALARAGTVIGMFSALMVDAILSGRNVLSLQPGGPSRDLCIPSRIGLIPKIPDVDAMVAGLEAGAGAAGPGVLRQTVAGSRSRLTTLMNSTCPEMSNT